MAARDGDGDGASTRRSSRATMENGGGGPPGKPTRSVGVPRGRRRPTAETLESSVGLGLGANNVWSRLLGNNAPSPGDPGASLGDESLENDEPPRMLDAASSFRASARSTLATLSSRPRIPLASLAVLGACLALGLGMLNKQCGLYEKQMLDVAEAHAKEALERFGDEFDKTLAPLFALAQVVKHDEALCELAHKIGSRGQPGALPGWPEEGKGLLLRDVRGVCDDKGLNERFAAVAESVRRDSGLGNAIGGLGAAPTGVMCMLHPVVNYDAYSHLDGRDASGVDRPHHNLTMALYNDWAWDRPSHINVLRKTLEVQEADENRVTITGPFVMKSVAGGSTIFASDGDSAAGDGTILTETLFCTHLGVSVPNHTLTMAGPTPDSSETYDSWGFVMGFVNWQLVVDRSGITDRFEELDMVYMLNRTLEYEDGESSETETAVKTDRIAWSRHRSVTTTDPDARISVTKSVNGDTWTLVAGYRCPTRPSWERGAVVAVVAASLVIALLVLSTLVKNQQHKDLLYKMMPRRAVRKLNRGQTVVEKYSCVTIFFSDIVGFTSMAGEMQPIEVMNMLNALYVEFDKLCKKHDCYKVETIGDAYMVVGGAPDRCPRSEAAEKVALFALEALECVENFRTPNDSTIDVRAGMASGAVVAGVVGSAMPRYCLFGDTVNYASRMESTSKRSRIQVCELTKLLLSEAPNRSFDLDERCDGNRERERTGTMVKGKGWKETWWLTGSRSRSSKSYRSNKHESAHNAVPLELDILSPQAECHSSLINNYDVRHSDSTAPSSLETVAASHDWSTLGQDLYHSQPDEGDQIEQVISLLEHRLLDLSSSRAESATTAVLPTNVRQELRSLVVKISSLYNGVHFHNFDHAYHVTISMNKLLDLSVGIRSEIKGLVWSNEMVCFAMVFAALIHDVGHLGMTNKMLVDQGHYLATKYKAKSVAESNSIDVAIDLLLNGDFSGLRASIFRSDGEMKAFLMLIRVAVLATDIACKDNNTECKELLACAFNLNHNMDKTEVEELEEYHAFKILTANNLDASQYDAPLRKSLSQMCSLIQHLLQAADIAHTMQSFENYIRWNYRLFKELNACYSSGLMPTDPGSFWATGEVLFFDNYVLPFASRLKQVSCTYSDEGISTLCCFAQENRDRWKNHGKQIAEIMATAIASGEDEEATIISILQECRVIQFWKSEFHG